MKSLIAILLALNVSLGVKGRISCEFRDTVNITGGQRIGDSYMHGNDSYPPGTYDEFDFVVEHFDERVAVDAHMRGCVCELKPCIRLCYAPNDPVAFEGYFMHSQRLTFDNGDDIELDFAEGRYGVLVGKPCAAMFMLDEWDEWHFSASGDISLFGQSYSSDSYCLGQLNDSDSAVAFMCFDDHDLMEYYAQFVPYKYGMLVSIPFLLFTICVYASIPKYRTLHGKSLICLCSTLLAFYSLKFVSYIHYDGVSRSSTCVGLGYSIYFTVMMSFIWMNIMCFDIYSISRLGMREKSAEGKKFKIYLVYGFGLPLLLTLLVIAIDSCELVSHEYRPAFGASRCWMADEKLTEAIYLFIPLSILIIVNVVLFALTACRIRRAQSGLDKTRAIFFIYLRIFFITGIPWSMEIFSWLYSEKSVFFFICDMLNCLQGVFIFLVCVLNAHARKAIAERWCCKYPDSANNSTSTLGRTTRVSVKN